jgi:hypothetical protein
MCEAVAGCISVSLLCSIFLGLLAVTVLSIVVIADYSSKTYYMPVDCYNCNNPTTEQFSLGYAGFLNCSYLDFGVEQTTSIRYPGNAPWAYQVNKEGATAWAEYNYGNNFTCYINPTDKGFGYQVLINPIGWFIVFLLFGLGTGCTGGGAAFKINS